MVSMLTSIAVDRGFEPRSGQTNDYKIGICWSHPIDFENISLYLYLYLYIYFIYTKNFAQNFMMLMAVLVIKALIETG
jgi:hypothetical protein